MVKLNKIYTRTGDDGTTGLADGSRRAKHDLRIEAYGDVDETNSAIGVARLHAGARFDAVLERVQNDLFDVGADLSTPYGEGEDKALRIVPQQVARLEQEIDDFNASLAALTSFVLPGGSQLSAHLHLARTICRRAERVAYAAAAREKMNPEALKYLNRLSDLLFVLSRAANNDGAGDVLWRPAKNR
jgi:cob(I)alamin adenosyltransferase